MDNPVNSIVDNGNEVPTHKPQPVDEAGTEPGIELPAPQPAKQPRNQHLKVAEPKDKQFAARATANQHLAITAAMQANGCRDIVELMLFSMDLHRKDILTPFKFK
jgi:hypothetical protein